jgi:23S rRNA (cytidine1920-2'-O)/16S rRNA (cytidine1409-2'-O)-methyltransferase
MKIRLDQLIFDKGLAESRTKAQALIMAGQILVDGKVADKVGQQIAEDAEIELKEKFPYVSRGALKLEKAYEEFGLVFTGKIICDIGSSTGGFTDFVLKNGAEKVYAVDVGRGQLDQRLRENPQVVVMEKTDFRQIQLPENIDYFVCDVSFISLKRIIPKISELTQPYSTQAILLIKPQFEVGKKEADRGKGVIKDPQLHQKVIDEIQECALKNGFRVKGVVPSPITGAKGNKEFLLWIIKA